MVLCVAVIEPCMASPSAQSINPHLILHFNAMKPNSDSSVTLISDPTLGGGSRMRPACYTTHMPPIPPCTLHMDVSSLIAVVEGLRGALRQLPWQGRLRPALPFRQHLYNSPPTRPISIFTTAAGWTSIPTLIPHLRPPSRFQQLVVYCRPPNVYFKPKPSSKPKPGLDPNPGPNPGPERALRQGLSPGVVGVCIPPPT